MAESGAFQALKGLGEDKFHKIVNAVMVGTGAPTVARMIQMEWGDLHGLAEKTLVQQLTRLRLSVAKGGFGDKAAQVLNAKDKLELKFLKNSNLSTLEELTALAQMQRERIQVQWDLERQVGKYNTHINVMVSQTEELLLNIQKIRFDLGMDEFKGVVPGVRMRGASETTNNADGSSTQRTVFDVVNIAESILSKRGLSA